MRNRIVTAVKQRFSIRKLSIGAASVLLGTSLYFMGGSATIVHADTNVSGGTHQTETSKEPASGQTGEENGSTDVQNPVDVAKDPTKDDTDVNQAIDDYANQKQKEQDEAGNKVVIRPSGKQPEKAADNATVRGQQVKDIEDSIEDSIDDGIAAANNDKAAIEDYKNKHQNQQILQGEESEAFKNQDLSVDDERNSEINKVTITDTKDKTKTTDVDTTAIDGPSHNIEIDGKKDAIVITHAGPDKMTDREKDTMQIKSDNKVIIDLNDKYQNKDITVTYSNLNNSYYLEKFGEGDKTKTNRIKISRIDRTFSGIQAGDIIFTSDGQTAKPHDCVYDKCDEPQLIIYKDPSDGFLYNNIKQVSVKDIYYDDKGHPITFKDGDNKDGDKNAWIFVTSLNSDGVGNNNHRRDGKEYVEKVKAENPDGTPAEMKKIAGSTVTGPVDENTTKDFTRTVELVDGHSNGDYLRNYLRTNADALKNQGWIWQENSSELTQTVTLHVKKTDAGYVYDNENEFFDGLELPVVLKDEQGVKKYADIEKIPRVRVTSSTSVEIQVNFSTSTTHRSPINEDQTANENVKDTHDGWWYSDESNSPQNNYPDWDNKSEDNRYAFVGAVAIQYQPGMTITYGADDTAWGSHWACTQTQVVSSLNERVIIYNHIKDGVIPVTPQTPPTDIPKKPDGGQAVDPNSLTKEVDLTVNYVNSDDTTFTGTLPKNRSQRVTFTGTAYVDKITGELVNAKQQADGTWVVDDSNTQDPQVIWKADGKDSFDAVISPVENGYHLTGIDSHRKGNNVEEITGLTQDSGSITVTVTYTKNGKIIPVDKNGNPITGAAQPVFPTDQTDPTKVDSGNIPDLSDKGYHPLDKNVKPGDPVDPDSEDPSKDITVKYVKSGTISVKYHDNTEDKDIDGYGKNASGDEDDPFNYDPATDLAKLAGKGYVLDGKVPEIPAKFTDGAQEVIINLKHSIIPVTPQTPPTDIPKKPDGGQAVDPNSLTKEVDLTVNYVNSDDTTFTGTLPKNRSQRVTFTGTAYVDKITGELVNAKQQADGTWVVDDSNTQDPQVIWKADGKDSFDAVISPVENGYHLTGIDSHRKGNNVEEITGLTQDSGSITVTVTYTKNGKIIPVDKNGNPITGAAQPVFPTDQTDPTKVDSGNIPDLSDKGYHPLDKNVKPGDPVDPDSEDPSKDITVKYVKSGTISVKYHDNTEDKDIDGYGKNASGDEDDPFNYDPATDLAKLAGKGYVLDGKVPEIPAKFTDGAQEVIINLKHSIIPVTPQTPPTDIPKKPDGGQAVDPNSLTKEVDLTVNYVNSDDTTFTGTLPKNRSQRVTFTGTAYVDKITGELVNAKQQADGTWVVDDSNTQDPQVIWKADGKDSFDAVISPVENGYHLTGIDSHRKGNNVEEITGLTQDSGSITVTVTYTKNGKIIPVDKNGNPITGAAQPVFPTDQTDPTKVDSGNIPDLSDKGYHPLDKNVKPGDPVDPDSEDPSKDITVKYVKSGTISVKYHDNTEDKDIDGYGKNASGDEDDPFNYDPATDLAKLAGKGYVLDGKVPEIPAKFTDGAQEVIINLKHSIIPVTPQTPPTDIPKKPDGGQAVDPNSLTKEVDLTVNYVNSDDTTFTGTLPKNRSQRVTFTGTAYVDKITGELVNAKQQADGTWVVDDSNTQDPQVIWKADGKDSFDAVISPVENGYHLTGIDSHRKGNNVEEITGLTQDSGSITVTVTYTKNGKIIPVDKNGNPITGAAQPVFPTDQTDPTKVDSGNIPDLSDKGYHPLDKNVKPGDPVDPDSEDPSKDITVKYVKSGTISVKYHDNTEDKDIDGYGKNASGDEDDPFNYDPATDLAKLAGKGYVLDGKVPEIPAKFTDGAQEVIINLKHSIIPVTPQTPPTDIPKKPDGGQAVDPNSLTKEVDLTVNYVNSDDTTFTGTLPKNRSQRVTFTGTAYVDKITGELVNAKQQADGTWVVDDSNTQDPQVIWTVKDSQEASFTGVTSPSEAGYEITGVEVKVGGQDAEDASAYTDGKDVKAVSDIDHNHANIDITVRYAAIPVVEQGSITVNVHDDTTDNDLQDYGKASGTQDVGTRFDYDKGSVIKSLTNAGYKVLHPEEIVIPTVITKGNQTITIYVIHTTTTVTSDNPGKPGEPVDPDNPDGPKYPDGTELDQVKRTGTQTIRYVGASDKTPADNTQTCIFTREITFDNVTGKIISVTKWNAPSYTFGNVDTPVIPGYHADKAVAGGATVTPDALNRVITVTYTPDGNTGNPSDHGDTPTPDDQPDSEISSDDDFENGKAKDKLDKTNPKEVAAYKKDRKIIKTKIAKQGHTEIAEPIEDKVTRENKAAEPKLPQTGEADNSIIGLLGMLLASFAAMFGFDSLHSHDKKHKN